MLKSFISGKSFKIDSVSFHMRHNKFCTFHNVYIVLLKADGTGARIIIYS